MATPLWDKALQAFEQLPNHVPAEKLELYYPDMKAAVKQAMADKDTAYSIAQSPDRVAQAVVHALTSNKPKTRYVVAPLFEKMLLFMKWLLHLGRSFSAVLASLNLPCSAPFG